MEAIVVPLSITSDYLSGLDNCQLLDLLLNRTRLLLDAYQFHLTDHAYIDSLREDICKIHTAIKSRDISGCK